MSEAKVRRLSREEAERVWRAIVSGELSLRGSFDAAEGRVVVATNSRPEGEKIGKSLSPREREVLEHAAAGFTNKRIGIELGLAASTVAMHLSSAAKKLGATSRVELVRAAQRASAAKRDEG